MNKQNWFFVVIFIIAFCGCSGNHLINDNNYRKVVESSFSETEKLAQNRKEELFGVFGEQLSQMQEEALKFLYAFMPLNDLADYRGEFFLANINMALKARQETPWGSAIPENIFLHYVLPVRVNTKNLDSFRIIYYDEIFDRIKNKEIIDAALEINHWCHEKVTYQPSDSRTSAPLGTILSARGRCGEESVFTVAALRTAGIPARQVYTPRWAHSDDNHAWVEFWNDGTWYYMGACEPEPVPDRGWFTEPARRAMLVHTKAFGAYSGQENEINRFKKYSEINNLSKYAVTKKIYVKTIDVSGNPVKDALVEYQLYNYAEFYPLAVVPADENGISSFETGLGDLFIWARNNDNFDFRKISVAGSDTIVLILRNDPPGDTTINLDLSVPPALSPLPGPPQDLIDENNKQLDEENRIRQEYMDTWVMPDYINKLQAQLGLDSMRTMAVLIKSMGNYESIISFLTGIPDTLRDLALSLLEVVAAKDLRDTRHEVLKDHLIFCATIHTEYDRDDSEFIQYILNPRIANEIITPWRSRFSDLLPEDLRLNASGNPQLIVDFLNQNISISENENYYKVPLTPDGVISLKVADSKSRSICFVAICRSFGIPARLEPGSNVPQYLLNSLWNDVYFADQQRPSTKKAFLKFESAEKDPVPEYYIHFTIAHLSNGRYNTLEYDYNKRIDTFRDELQLTPGNYMLVTGNRINDSKILSGISFFSLEEGEHRTINIKLRKDVSSSEKYGNIDRGKILTGLKDNNNLTGRITGKKMVILWIEPDKEPTKHVLNDLPVLKKELDAWDGIFVFLSGQTSADGIGINADQKSKLPSNSVFETDDDFRILKSIREVSDFSPDVFPLVLIVAENVDILFRSEGYRIGIGEQILKYITQ